jgi:CRISPR-associated protein Cmr6
MATLSDIAQKVPMVFRAQINGRCQLQRIERDRESDAKRWVDEWVDKAYPDAPAFGDGVKTQTQQISWRFVTNGGQDDGVIRPVIGARGVPFYPGSSMKGVFRQACTPGQADRYCGEDLRRDSFKPGILRFHGGYPADNSWTEQLLDIVHPQQDRQVKEEGRSSAFVQISLYQPKMQFGISSTEPLTDEEWQTVWGIWEKALSTGIGCRVSAGYGHPAKRTGDVLYRSQLKGQGQAAKLLNGPGEFRPNVLRAALRGHALRIFGGLTTADHADRLVEQLFGGVRGHGTVGLLSMAFQQKQEPSMDWFGQGAYAQPTYEVEGTLVWMLNRPLADPEQLAALKTLVRLLNQFAMLLGGFGKSWRRADHRLFFADYYEDDPKPLIGCHWQWRARSLSNAVNLRKLEQVGSLIDKVQQAAIAWMRLQRVEPTPENSALWREAWHPDGVQVWGRLTSKEEPDECVAIHWLHGAYQDAIPTARIQEGSIYRSSVTGQMGQIGRLWHRMFPVVQMVPSPDDPNGKKMPVLPRSPRYLELLTIFPDDSRESTRFLEFLNGNQTLFQKVWGGD